MGHSQKRIPKLVKFLLFTAGVFLMEFILDWAFDLFQTQDEFSAALTPYQNSYFSLHPHFIVIQDLGNEYSGNTSASLRFLLSLLLALPVYGIVLAGVRYIKALARYEKKILRTCLYSILALCLFVVFFIPKKKTSFDREKQQMRITTRKMFLFPETITIAYNSIQGIRYEYASRYNLSDHAYNLYMKFYIDYQGKKIVLGDKYLGYNTKLPIDKNFKPMEEMEKEAVITTMLLNRLIK